MKSLKILFLHMRPPTRNAQTILDHAMSFRRHSRHDVTHLSLRYPFGTLPALDLAHFDVIVIHYTIVAKLDEHLRPEARDAIARFDGLKVQFIQDEYRYINETIDATRRLGVDVLFTCVPDAEIEKVYSAAALPRVLKVSVLTGYVPDGLARLAVPAIVERPVDVGYRARKPPYWLGALGLEKWRVAEGFLAAARDSGLVCDISSEEVQRLYGARWTRFLTSCKAVLGVESGASVFDFTGEIQRGVEAHMRANPEAAFEEVRDLYFAQEEGKIRLNQISPRCFEAAALRTAMVLFEGEYSGILAPGRHYIPLRKDFGNASAVVEQLRDPALLQQYVDRTFEEVALNPAYSYASFVRLFDDVVEQEFGSRIGPRRSQPRKSAEILPPRAKLALHIQAFEATQITAYFLRAFALRFVGAAWSLVPEAPRARIRPILRSLLQRVSTGPRTRN